MSKYLITFIIITAIIHIRAKYKDLKLQEYIFKPLTTSLIILIALQANPSEYKNHIIIGLIFSLFGDIFIMLSEDKFIFGLVSFLIAHIIYIYAFLHGNNFIIPFYLIIPFLIFGMTMYSYLYKSLNELKAPVFIYVSIILIMGVSALNLWYLKHDNYSLYAFIGSLFFIVSDSILAVDKFKKPMYYAQLSLLSTYYISQTLIALSIK
ncbi:MAG: lysoplasmalogenase [Candidatus Sericytochromatia bacterium]